MEGRKQKEGGRKEPGRKGGRKVEGRWKECGRKVEGRNQVEKVEGRWKECGRKQKEGGRSTKTYLDIFLFLK
ncbi:hypothetical protein EV1_002114 [Malus domestica]